MVTRDKADYKRKVHEKAVVEKRQMAIERNAMVAGGDSPPPTPVTRLIKLEHGEHLDSTLYRFEKGCRVQFCPGSSLLGRKVFLYTNYVVGDEARDAEFVRNQYYGVEWRVMTSEGETGEPLGAGPLLTDTDVCAEVALARAGSFHYYFVYDSAESPVGPQGSGWFHAAPTLCAGGRNIPLDAVSCQTVLAKCLGPLSRWESVLRVAAESGYNMIHFTPIQELGASNSSYSIANQLRLNTQFGSDVTFADVENIVAKMRNEWKMLSICDIVLNHTANETPWLIEHPEATYNCMNCPHLRPAALLDALLCRLTADVASGHYETRALPTRITTHQHIETLRHILSTQLIPEARLHEIYMCDVTDIVQQFYYMARNKVPGARGQTGNVGTVQSEGVGAGVAGEGAGGKRDELRLVQDPQYRRLRATVDMDLALQLYNVYRAECYDEESRVQRCCDALRRDLEQLNEAAADAVRGHLRAAIDNAIAGMRYFRLQSDGPKIEEVSAKNPLVPRYFTWACGVENISLSEVESVVYSDAGLQCMAHNGWVMEADPLQDFAAREQHGRVYMRRELIAWGDSVKLRYGDKPEDSPFLWKQMRDYVELTAELFDGLRLDNSHSTPLHVAEYMLDSARNVKPDLYVVAELFTNSDQLDNIFVNRLGITSLIREALSACDSREQGRLVHRFGGEPVGAFIRGTRHHAQPSVAHAILMDLTHDNPSPLDKRSVYDMMPSAALVSMACCATGSTRGYDELVPHHIHVVDETRLYCEWQGDDNTHTNANTVSIDTGVIAVKRALNELHHELALHGYTEVYVDQIDADIVAVTRHEPRTRRSVIMLAFTAFNAHEHISTQTRTPKPLRFEGQLDEIILEAELQRRTDNRDNNTFVRDTTHINGLDEYAATLRRALTLDRSTVFAREHRDGPHTVLEFKPLLPGAVVAVRVSPRPEHAAALATLRHCAEAPPAADPLNLTPTLADLDLADFNALLYRCEAEERDAVSAGTYDVPGRGPLVYAGLQGVVSLLAEVTPTDDLGHPLCENLRAGDWLLEYQWTRLQRDPRLAAIADKYKEALRPVSALPRYLIPAYFASVVSALYRVVVRATLSRMSGAAQGDTFSRALSLTSVQLSGAVPSASLPAPSPASPPPRLTRSVTLSAGLPHFAAGYMRCWGRDTFISLRGLFLLTGRHQDARHHILGYAAGLRHGLIPNLLDGGRNARYNCRDAVWWWMHSVKQYCTETPHGYALLTEPVARLYPKDDSDPTLPGQADQPLHDVLQEALDVHFQGLTFRERNAGRNIDAHMTDKGFNLQIGIDPDTGFPFGGNDHNCGTWMDKMGSSERAGTRGRAATPRDGSAIELVALAYSVVSWLATEHRAGRYPYPGVVRRHRDATLTSWTYAQWADRLRNTFERHFWIPAAPSARDPRPDLVHRRAIYKDTHGASRPWADYQLRCNFPVAMAIAPELFDARHAWQALDQLERTLLGPLGVKTLDPADWAYRPDYDNSNDTDDPNIAHGFNYHQGPEWVWPLGFYLRARLAFAHECGKHARTLAATYAALGPLHAHLRTSPWRGLPELTNAGGAPCSFSCHTQAWSSATVLEVLHDLDVSRRARSLSAD